MAWRIDGLEGRERFDIGIGQMATSRTGGVVRTVLGSCIAVCLRDARLKVGGMNHFMLPEGSEDGFGVARFGVHAMELLINHLMALGADRRRLEAKVFGGGHVLAPTMMSSSVPDANIQFVREFLRVEGLTVKAEDVGGFSAREVYFFTDSGRILMRRLKRVEASAARLPDMKTAPIDDANVTLF